jgi:hypothetical protein
MISYEGFCQFCGNEIGAGHKPGCPYYVPPPPPPAPAPTGRGRP